MPDNGEDVISAALLDLSVDDEGVARQAEAALGLTWGRRSGRSRRIGFSSSCRAGPLVSCRSGAAE
jgi:hypothetical protein